jgi:hypothetical protein
MLELEAMADDDASFLDLASGLVAGAADANRLSDLVVTHVDHWFGPRWLGFRGKGMGVVGVRNRRLTDALAPPPFHPHRILSVREYRLGGSKVFEDQGDVGWLHGHRSSESNVRRSLPRGRLYAWYCGGTVASGKAVVMVYVVHEETTSAWYVGFVRGTSWHLSQTVAIAPSRVHQLLEAVPQRSPA